MTRHTVFDLKLRHNIRGLTLPLVLFFFMLSVTVSFVAYVLWPTWPKAAVSLEAPSVPVIVSGVLFKVPPAAIRTPMQRQPGAHERLDLVFLWPSLLPPSPEKIASAAPSPQNASDAPPVNGGDRLFVTIAGLGNVLPPAERLRSVYPRYFDGQPTPGDDGLAVLAFRAGTPYEGEDLIYPAEDPDRFFARCTREAVRPVPATCIHERLLDAAEMTLRFPRVWLRDWHGVVANFDRLTVQLHEQADGTAGRKDDR